MKHSYMVPLHYSLILVDSSGPSLGNVSAETISPCINTVQRVGVIEPYKATSVHSCNIRTMQVMEKNQVI